MAKPDIERQKEWENRINEYLASGLTATAWCAANDVKVNRLRYWLKKLTPAKTQNSTRAKWLSVVVDESDLNGQGNGLTIRVGHAVVEVQRGFDPALLVEVVQTLTTLC